MLTIRSADERGHVNFGWLQSWHSFSFGHYYDPRYMGVSALRVINQDNVAPGGGFPTHPHHDMEILSYVLRGTLEHKDSMGNIQRIAAGEFQLMSAGSGITHSEYNGSSSDSAEFLQIWIVPAKKGLPPSYQQQAFNTTGVSKIVSADGSEGTLQIHQDVTIYLGRHPQATSHDITLTAGRQAYLQLVKGSVQINNNLLQAGDGVAVSAADREQLLTIESAANSEWLWFDLP
jgi:redox-sensitive bicupin YhaK (pirin superfamily)